MIERCKGLCKESSKNLKWLLAVWVSSLPFAETGWGGGPCSPPTCVQPSDLGPARTRPQSLVVRRPHGRRHHRTNIAVVDVVDVRLPGTEAVCRTVLLRNPTVFVESVWGAHTLPWVCLLEPENSFFLALSVCSVLHFLIFLETSPGAKGKKRVSTPAWQPSAW